MPETKRWARASAMALQLPEHPDPDPLHLRLVHDDRPHLLVRRLEAHLAVLAVPALERRLAGLQERHHRLAVARGGALLAEDDVAGADAVLDHRGAAHAQ